MSDDDNVSRAEFESLVRKVDENTKLTQEVRDILATFRILFHVAKWTTAMVLAYSAVITFVRTIKGS